MRSKKEKILKYYPNLVQLEYMLAQPNRHWYIDYTEIIINGKKFHILIVIDGCFNEVVKASISYEVKISATETIRKLKSAFKERRIPDELEKEDPDLIIIKKNIV